MNDKELELALTEFVGAFEIVFRYDWDYSKTMIGDEEEGHNFIEPGLEDETNDWGARGALLEKYRQLVEVMKEKQLEPRFPFPLEHLDKPVKRIW